MSVPGRIVRATELVPRPWPNGLGTTRDIAGETAPEGRIGWLLSLADLERDAPFSHLPGADRIFTLVEGDPVALSVNGGDPILCSPLVPAHFPGDLPTSCRMTGGPGRAFNVFVDRTRYRARVSAMSLAAGHGVLAFGETSAAFCVTGELALEDGGAVGTGETWIGSAGITLRASLRPATLLLVGIDPA